LNNSGAADRIANCSSEAYLQGYADFPPWTHRRTPQSTQDFSGPPRSSLFDDILFFWKRTASSDDVAAAISDPRISAAFAKRIIASSWLVQLEFMSGVISQLETKLWSFEDMELQPSANAIKTEISGLRSLLASVNRWRRRIWWYMDHTRCNLEALGQTLSNSKPTLKGGKEDAPHRALANIDDLVLEDFLSVNERLQYCKDRLESLMPVVMGAFSLLEAQQGTLETKYVTRLTSLALIFVPLSFVTGLFSMSGGYLPGESKFWIFLAVSLPLVVFVFASMFATKYIQSGWRRLTDKAQRQWDCTGQPS
jgi:hypothetical protein